ncbi:hypothetical protein A4G99_14975 [Haladaptatus sp. R4]|nr:hypothetical protein A4G99_14975 [Haladaptatus sp. R4]
MDPEVEVSHPSHIESIRMIGFDARSSTDDRACHLIERFVRRRELVPVRDVRCGVSIVDRRGGR